MRFCPFCSHENADELAVCQSCGRRLPPLPPRRARNAPPTGVQLPPRPAPTGPSGPRPAVPVPPGSQPGVARSQAMPPPAPVPVPPGSQPGVARGQAPPQPVPPGSQPGVSRSQSMPPQVASAKSAAFAPVPPGTQPGVAKTITSPGFAPIGSRPPAHVEADDEFTLVNAVAPGPAAQRREPPPPEPVDPSLARRRSDQPPAGTPAPQRSSPPPSPNHSSSGSGARAIPSIAPASSSGRNHAPSQPPPLAPAPAPRAGSTYSDDFNTVVGPPIIPELEAPVVEATRARIPDGVEPPPTRIHRPEALVDRPFTPPKVSAVPEIPEPGLVSSARYTIRFQRARWQRRGAIKTLGAEIKQDTEALDQVLGALGRVARTARIDGRVFSAENAAISEAEQRTAQLGKEHGEVDARKAEENSKFVDIERERNTKLTEAERMVDEAQKELQHLEGQRRSQRDKRKELERRQKAYLKAAEDNDRQAGAAQMGDSRGELRRSAEQHRKEAAALEPERQEIDRRLAGLERPIGEATARLDAAKAELDAAKRSLSDAREGHAHRLDELDAEQKRKSREIAQSEAEIQRRLVTLGTLVNLNRIEDPQFGELYLRIDRLRGAITARTTEIEKLTAEREAYDRGTLIRGISALGGAVVAFIALIVILRAIL